VNEEDFGPRWFRHYAPLVLASVVAGLVGAGAYLTLIPAHREAWTIVVETNDKIPALQLAQVSEAIFRSKAVYGPALRSLQVHESSQSYLAAHTDIQPVPNSNTLIVVGRAATLPEAETISTVFSRSLVRAFASRQGAEFSVFSGAQPGALPTRIGLSTGIALGAFIGLWLGLAAAAIHFKWRRPVMTLASAGDLLRPDHTITFGKQRRWPGLRSGTSTPKEREIEQRRLEAIRDAIDKAGSVHLIVSGSRRLRRSGIMERLASVAGTSPDGEPASSVAGGLWLIACDPSTSRRDLVDVRERVRPKAHRQRAPLLQLMWFG